MHAHTLSQLDLVQREARASSRRTGPSSAAAAKEDVAVSAMGVLREESSVGSVDSGA